MAVEFAPQGVRVNTIVCGMVLTSEGAYKMMEHPVIGPATKALHLTRPRPARPTSRTSRCSSRPTKPRSSPASTCLPTAACSRRWRCPTSPPPISSSTDAPPPVGERGVVVALVVRGRPCVLDLGGHRPRGVVAAQVRAVRARRARSRACATPGSGSATWGRPDGACRGIRRPGPDTATGCWPRSTRRLRSDACPLSSRPGPPAG